MRTERGLITKKIFVFFSLAIVSACQTNPKQIRELSMETTQPEASSEDINWLYTKNGKASYQLLAPEMLRYDSEETYTEFPKGLELYSFEQEGPKDAYLKADYAIQKIKSQTFEAEGNVLLQNAKGEKLETEQLTWDEAEERIYTDKFVKITKQDQVIMGEGFESDIYFSHYTLKKSRGIINLPEQE